MTDPQTLPPFSGEIRQQKLSAISLWLDTPQPSDAADDLPLLHSHLDKLRTCEIAPQQRAQLLEKLYSRGLSVIHTLRPLLINDSLPIPRKTRQLIRRQQAFLQSLAEDLRSCATEIYTHHIRLLPPPEELLLWRSLRALTQHLLISNLVASPPGIGIWQQLHQTYAVALSRGIATNTPEKASCNLQTIYYSAILLGCAQPASFTSREVNFVATYLEHFSDCIDIESRHLASNHAVFWIDPARNTPAVASSRKAVPPATSVATFSCERLVQLLKEQLAALKTGIPPQQINLPDFAGTPAGLGVLRRLIAYWGEPGKRRFPRRRQNYRAVLCVGLDSLWRLFQHGDAAPIETSSWMITNESPDGYAIMHVSGKTSPMSVGDITAIRTETGTNWQVCIIRWALSENQEHLELGLQILSAHAIPATLPQHSATSEEKHLSALILPEIPALRTTEMLVVPAGTRENQSGKFILVIEKENIEIREVENARIDEQNSHVEIFSTSPPSSN